MPRKTLLPLLLALVALFVAPAASNAATTNVAVGIGDQAQTIFDNSSFQALGVKKVRYFIKWDAMKRPEELAQADQYVANAQRSGADVLMHISTNDLGIKTAKLPSVKTYSKAVKQLIDRYKPQGVKTWGAFNEANHASQPTWNNPKRAAQFYLELKKLCKGCSIVGLDILDQAGAERYIQRFYAALTSSQRAGLKVVGIHNYSDTNRNRDTGTKAILKAVKKYNSRTQFWLTETGGVAKFGKSFPCNPASASSVKKAETRQSKAVKFMFTLTKRFKSDIKRLYIYNFTGDDCEGRFDAGLVRRDGTHRPAYNEVKRQMKSFKR